MFAPSLFFSSTARSCLHSVFKDLPNIALHTFVHSGEYNKYKLDYIQSLENKMKKWPLNILLEDLYDIQYPSGFKYDPSSGFYDEVGKAKLKFSAL